jgi:hypothetical protein
MEFMTKIKILSNGLVETGVLREKTLTMAKLRVDYSSLPLFLYRLCLLGFLPA